MGQGLQDSRACKQRERRRRAVTDEVPSLVGGRQLQANFPARLSCKVALSRILRQFQGERATTRKPRARVAAGRWCKPPWLPSLSWPSLGVSLQPADPRRRWTCVRTRHNSRLAGERAVFLRVMCACPAGALAFASSATRLPPLLPQAVSGAVATAGPLAPIYYGFAYVLACVTLLPASVLTLGALGCALGKKSQAWLSRLPFAWLASRSMPVRFHPPHRRRCALRSSQGHCCRRLERHRRSNCVVPHRTLCGAVHLLSPLSFRNVPAFSQALMCLAPHSSNNASGAPVRGKLPGGAEEIQGGGQRDWPRRPEGGLPAPPLPALPLLHRQLRPGPQQRAPPRLRGSDTRRDPARCVCLVSLRSYLLTVAAAAAAACCGRALTCKRGACRNSRRRSHVCLREHWCRGPSGVGGCDWGGR